MPWCRDHGWLECEEEWKWEELRGLDHLRLHHVARGHDVSVFRVRYRALPSHTISPFCLRTTSPPHLSPALASSDSQKKTPGEWLLPLFCRVRLPRAKHTHLEHHRCGTRLHHKAWGQGRRRRRRPSRAHILPRYPAAGEEHGGERDGARSIRDRPRLLSNSNSNSNSGQQVATARSSLRRGDGADASTTSKRPPCPLPLP